MKTKVSDFLLLFVFLGVIFSFTIWFWVKGSDSTSILENRTLAQRPDATAKNVLTGDYPKRFETFYNDQFPARETFVETNSKMNKFLLRQDVVRNVYVHKDGYLLSPVPEFSLDRAKDISQRINTFAQDTDKFGAKTFFVLMPNKAVMMEDKFPDYFPSYGRKDSKQLLGLIDPAANPIYPFDAVNKHLSEKNMYFYSDHHWKAKAAFYAYQDVIGKMAKTSPEIGKALQLDEFTWTEKGKPFYGSDSRKTTKSYVKQSDTITVATPKTKEKPFEIRYRGKDGQSFYKESFLTDNELYANRYAAYMGGDHPETVITNPNKPESAPKLLIIKDSYANPTIQFFSRHFKETRVLDLRHFDNMTVPEYAKKHKITHVMILHNVNSIYVTPSLTNYNNPGQGENQ
ncbi:DHHW family protein [Peribacillus sp. SCS-155]|uniref:DHHW family protein n=1 Tax=Peribacillus sedimenti TaxID=3115297 RepID=UPI0039064597